MGCTQSSRSALPPNHIPIEHLYDSGSYQNMHTSPIVMINPPFIPSYLKSALKKSDPYDREPNNRRLFTRRKQLPMNKAVNFDEQVLVRARTPTPIKSWYEKKSSTMPMRLNPRDDDDDDDDDNDGDDGDYDEEYDDDGTLLNEDQENREYRNTESLMPRLGTPTPLMRRNQLNPFGRKANTIGVMSSTDSTLNDESFLSSTQQNFHTNTNDSSIPSTGGRIKVRRRQPNFGPPQVLTGSPSEPLRQPSAMPLYQSSTQPSGFLIRKSAVKPLIVPLHKSPGQPSLVSAYRIAPQTSIVSSYQPPVLQSSITPLQQPTSIQPKPTLVHQSTIQAQLVPNYQSVVLQPQPGSIQVSSAQTPIVSSYPLAAVQPQAGSVGQSSVQSSIVAIPQIPTQLSTMPSHQFAMHPSSENIHTKQTDPNTNNIST